MSTERCPTQRTGRCTVITLPAEIDATNAEELSGELLRVLDEGPAVIIADMSATVFCDSSGIRMLLQAHRRAAEAGARLRVTAGAYAVRRMLELTAADQMIDVCPDLRAALAALPPGADRDGSVANA
jgi:anti-sigma B factor antagonist